MAKLRHIRIQNTETSHPYTYPREVRGREFSRPVRDRDFHAQKLGRQLRDAVAAATQQHAGAPPDSYPIAIEFRSDRGYRLLAEALQDRRYRPPIELANVHDEGEVQVAVVHVPPGKVSAFIRRINEYASEQTAKGAFRHAELVESIAEISLAVVRSFWTDDRDLFPADDEHIWWEVWLRRSPGERGLQAENDFRGTATQAGIETDSAVTRFSECAVLLARCTPNDWAAAPDLLNYLDEFRKAKELPTPYVIMSPQEQGAAVQELRSRVTEPPPGAPAVCILDTGVARGHPLLSLGMDEDSAMSVDGSWPTSDREGHGTGIAGLCLFGCLTGPLATQTPISLAHFLESVKILPPVGQNDPKNYGSLTQEAVARAEARFPARNRAVCMAVTGDSRDQGYPSLWSAGVDQLCAGELDGVRRLLFVSSGNIRTLRDRSAGYRYPSTNYWEGIEDPGQSWNAMTVGAYTDLAHIRSPDYQGWRPVAMRGLLCPTSRTSASWQERAWPLKPDIVLEGGNWAADGSGRLDTCDDLCLLTTARPDASGRLLTTFGDTSGATALAARMAAVILADYPGLWPETIRGLLVHSATWTPQMLAEFRENEREKRLRCYGYGVPTLDRALWSAENAVTLIFQGELYPYEKAAGESRIRTREMHIHQIPWPIEVLEQYAVETVRMRVTLSYFIEPSPGRRGWTRKHRYQSHGLRFDVKRPAESVDEFAKRLSREAREEDEDVPETPGGRLPWRLGWNLQKKGSVHSDWWEGSAVDLAGSGYVGVFPVTGWWRERRHLARWDSVARYSLIISLETERTDIDLYTEIANKIAITPEITV